MTIIIFFAFLIGEENLSNANTVSDVRNERDPNKDNNFDLEFSFFEKYRFNDKNVIILMAKPYTATGILRSDSAFGIN